MAANSYSKERQHLANSYLEEDDLDLDKEEGDFVLVDVREEIMQIKDQFDSLMNCLDSELFPVNVVDKKESVKHSRITVQLFVVMGIALGHLLDGTVLAYTAMAIPSLTHENSTLDHNKELITFVSSAHSMGATMACLVAGIAMSVLGRRGATLFCTVPAYTVGYLLIGSAANMPMIIAGRFLTGVGLGLTLSIPNVYIVEVTSPEFRGVLGVIPNIFCQVGIFITYVLGHFMDWSQLAYTFAAIGIPFLAAVWYIPESPQHLIRKGNILKAEATFTMLDLDSSRASVQPNSLATPDGNNNVKQTVASVISDPANYKPFLTGLTLMAFFQATAYPILIGNTVTLFREANKNFSEHLSSIIVGMAIIACAVATIPLAKKCDRKNLLGISALGVSVCLFVLGAFYYLKSIDLTDGLHWLPLVDFLVYIGFFMTGYGSVSWLVFAEVLPPSIRSTAYPLGIAIMWLINFILTTLYEPMLMQIKTHGFMWVYASLSALGTIFIAICLPETRDKTAQEIASHYTPLNHSSASSNDSQEKNQYSSSASTISVVMSEP